MKVGLLKTWLAIISYHCFCWVFRLTRHQSVSKHTVCQGQPAHLNTGLATIMGTLPPGGWMSSTFRLYGELKSEMFLCRIYSINSGGDVDEKFVRCCSFSGILIFFQEISASAFQSLDHIKSHFLISDPRACKPIFICYLRDKTSIRSGYCQDMIYQWYIKPYIYCNYSFKGILWLLFLFRYMRNICRCGLKICLIDSYILVWKKNPICFNKSYLFGPGHARDPGKNKVVGLCNWMWSNTVRPFDKYEITHKIWCCKLRTFWSYNTWVE